MLEVIAQLRREAGIAFRRRIGALDLEHQRHEGLGDKAAAVNAV